MMETLSERSYDGHAAPEWANFLTLLDGVWYWEESLEQQDGHKFQNIEFNYEHRYFASTLRGYGVAYKLPRRVPPVPTQPYLPAQPSAEDALPPAPTHEMYMSNTGRRWTDLLLEQECISIGFNSTSYRVRVSASTARDMAHDLIRMAMELERRAE